MTERLLAGLDAVNAVVGRAIALLIYAMIGVIMYEVCARYFFNAPTPWAHDVSGWLQVAYIFLGGGLALQRGYFVRVDIVYGALSERAQAAIDLTVATVLFVCFAAVLIWKGGELAYTSFAMSETSATGAWEGPVFPAKLMVPLGTGLLALAWLAHIVRQARRLLAPDSRP